MMPMPQKPMMPPPGGPGGGDEEVPPEELKATLVALLRKVKQMADSNGINFQQLVSEVAGGKGAPTMPPRPGGGATMPPPPPQGMP